MTIKFGVLIVSRNNYEMQRIWRERWNLPKNSIVLNIDEGSTQAQRKIGVDICKKLGIHFLDSDVPGLHFNLIQAFRFFMERGIDWILYSQHDAYPLGEYTLRNLNKNIIDGKYDSFGVIGFNVHDGPDSIKDFDELRMKYQTTARSILQLGNGWYSPKSGSRITYPKVLGKMFAVESVHWSNALLSKKSFFDHIKPDPFYMFFHAWDDIAFQFLSKEIPNVVDSSLSFAHNQSLKMLVNLPSQSPKTESEKKRFFYYNKWGHLEHWREKWGFRWDVQKIAFDRFPLLEPLPHLMRTRVLWNLYSSRISCLETRTRYDIRVSLNEVLPSTLMTEFYNHDPKHGFLKDYS
jgi:hypothetical protein